MRKMFKVFLSVCVMVCIMTPVQLFAEEDSFWIIDLGEGYTINVLEVAKENGVNPYELRQAILEDMEAEIFSPFSKVNSTKEVPAPSESVEYLFDANTRSVRALARKNNQTATGYTGDPGKETASGKTPAVGMCAMDVDVTTKTGTTTDEIIRLGTKIYLDNFIDVNGTSLSSLTIEDRGTGAATHTKFWIDVCFGITTPATDAAATIFGSQTVSYSYIY